MKCITKGLSLFYGLLSTFCKIPKNNGWEDCSTHPSPSLAWWNSLQSYRSGLKFRYTVYSHESENAGAFFLRFLSFWRFIMTNIERIKVKTWHHLAVDFDFFVWIQTWKAPHFLQAICLDSPKGSSPSAAVCANPEAKNLCLPFWTTNCWKLKQVEEMGYILKST